MKSSHDANRLGMNPHSEPILFPVVSRLHTSAIALLDAVTLRKRATTVKIFETVWEYSLGASIICDNCTFDLMRRIIRLFVVGDGYSVHRIPYVHTRFLDMEYRKNVFLFEK
jgi:hypothetical protein